MFHTLSLIRTGFINALSAVLWIGVMLFFIMYISALLITAVVGHNASVWEDRNTTSACFSGICPLNTQSEEVQHWFGTVPRSMFTLFMVTTLAGWPLVVDAFHEHFWPIGILLLLYIVLTTYTMISMVVAVMCEKMMTAVRDDQILKLREVDEAHEQFIRAAEEIFLSIDREGNNDECVSMEELVEAMVNPKGQLLEMCASLGVGGNHVGISEAEFLEVFHLAFSDPEKDGRIDIQYFVSALSRLRGEATAKHIFALECQLYKRRKRLIERFNRVERGQRAIMEHFGIKHRRYSKRSDTTSDTGSNSPWSPDSSPIIPARAPASEPGSPPLSRSGSPYSTPILPIREPRLEEDDAEI